MTTIAPVSCGPCATQCLRCGRSFDTGEGIWSALLGTPLREKGGEKARQRIDFCQSCWTGPKEGLPEGVICWFRAVCNRETLGSQAQSREQLLLGIIQPSKGLVVEEGDTPGNLGPQEASRYAAALGLWRMQRLRLDSVDDRGGCEILRFRITGTQKRFEVVNPGLSEEELRKMEEELVQKAQEDLRLGGLTGYSPEGNQAA